jgi:NAD(P)-dependent dehydrogenase (short-subunit alcohol dehydrogenase family)
VGLTRCIALENAKNGINVNAICPGIVETDLIKGVEQRMEAQGMPPDEFRERILAQIPMGRFLQPEEIAHIAVFLASSESDGMNGEAIAI